MKAFVFGFETPKPQWEEKPLESPAFGQISGQPTTSNYRWVLLPNGHAPQYGDGKPILMVEQQFKSGDWGSAGGGWSLHQLLYGNQWSAPATGDVICLDGRQQWYVSGLQAALNEAKAILNL